MKVFGIIPARGGSKSIPLKNIKLLNGKPLIEYTIETALASKVLDRIAISTDHEDIIRICQQYEEIDVIVRPPELATDEAPTEWTLLHACDEIIKKDNFLPDVVLTLEPTSPLRSIQTIKQCIDIFKTTDADSVIGVTETRACYGKIVDGRFEYLFPNQPRRRQERKPLYKESSTIYATKLDTLRYKNSVLGEKLYTLIISCNEAIDINESFDFKLIEALINLKKG
jgi:CMP-N-acetylneuraminic acid synthetase|tara:strand:+ start:535 stop:1212 length:678 start_codon:yes stop_codon:yes gene_type:complete